MRRGEEYEKENLKLLETRPNALKWLCTYGASGDI